MLGVGELAGVSRDGSTVACEVGSTVGSAVGACVQVLDVLDSLTSGLIVGVAGEAVGVARAVVGVSVELGDSELVVLVSGAVTSSSVGSKTTSDCKEASLI